MDLSLQYLRKVQDLIQHYLCMQKTLESAPSIYERLKKREAALLSNGLTAGRHLLKRKALSRCQSLQELLVAPTYTSYISARLLQLMRYFQRGRRVSRIITLKHARII